MAALTRLRVYDYTSDQMWMRNPTGDINPPDKIHMDSDVRNLTRVNERAKGWIVGRKWWGSVSVDAVTEQRTYSHLVASSVITRTLGARTGLPMTSSETVTFYNAEGEPHIETRTHEYVYSQEDAIDAAIDARKWVLHAGKAVAAKAILMHHQGDTAAARITQQAFFEAHKQALSDYREYKDPMLQADVAAADDAWLDVVVEGSKTAREMILDILA